MALGLIGKKCGMTRVFTEQGVSIPVTVIEVLPNRITQLKIEDRDGYTAVQVTAGKKESASINKPMAGHFAKASVEAGECLREFRVDAKELENKKVGDSLTLEFLAEGDKVDVTGITIGKGFAGAVKRHHFRTQDATHGNSLSHRAPGSIGQCQTPGRVKKGKRMAGHMGNVQRTAVNQEVVCVDAGKNIVLVKGAIPGHKGRMVVIRKSVKSKGGK